MSAGTNRKVDAIVIGADIDGLVAARTLAKSGKKVLLVDEGDGPGGTLREIEFAAGYRAAPLAPAADRTLVALGEGAPIVLQDSTATTVESLKVHSARMPQTGPPLSNAPRRWRGFSRSSTANRRRASTPIRWASSCH